MTEKSKNPSVFYFCLDHFHPAEGTPGNALPDDASRYFASDEGGCPTCPKCNRQVSAAVVPDDQTLPPSVAAAVKRSARDLTNSPTGPGPQERFAVQSNR